MGIIGGITYAIVNTLARTRVRELEIRERIAMIDKGLVPSPEADPRGFDRAMSRGISPTLRVRAGGVTAGRASPSWARGSA